MSPKKPEPKRPPVTAKERIAAAEEGLRDELTKQEAAAKAVTPEAWQCGICGGLTDLVVCPVDGNTEAGGVYRG